MNMEVHPLRVVIKALFLFVVINIVYALIDPPVHELSAYNFFFPGRVRLPFGDFSDPYVVMIDDLDAMFASHAISRKKDVAEYRVVLIGDSSVWGEGIPVGESISVQWNNLNLKCGERVVVVYNLGYPHPSVIKDLVILDRSIETDPDLIVWFVTLNTLIPRRLSPFLAANRERVFDILTLYEIPFAHEESLAATIPGFYEKTLIDKRSYLARWIKLQFLSIVWAATGADSKTLSGNDDILSPDVENDMRYRGLGPETSIKNMMLLNALAAGHDIADLIPILIVNEPIFIAGGENSAVRYNDGYPRWAYDEYRDAMVAEANISQWNYMDLWDALQPGHFSDAGLHLSEEGERILIERINPAIQQLACQ